MAKPTYSYVLHRGEAVGTGMVRIMETMGTDAEELARKAETDLQESVHQLRTLIKRLRAYLWFIRPALGKARYARNNAALRKAAHRLEKTRDVHAVRSALAKAAHPDTHEERLKSLVQVAQGFAEREANGRKATTSLAPLKKAIGAVVEVVAGTILRLKQAKEWPSPKGRVEEALQLSKKAERKARDADDAALVHDWRKKTKRLFYLLQLTVCLHGTAGKDAVRKADELQELLGDHQDAVVAENYLREHAGHIDADDLERTRHLLQKARKGLLEDAEGCWREMAREF